MWVSWSVGHHFEPQPAGHPSHDETVDELGVGHAQPLTMSIPFWVMAHTMP
jgi:hypothetical protein